MLLGFAHFFGGQSQKRAKFSNLEMFDLGMPSNVHSESKRL